MVQTETLVTYRKKLIEVALPLEAINKASDSVRTIRHDRSGAPRRRWVQRRAWLRLVRRREVWVWQTQS